MIEQRSKEWFEQRIGKITGSRAGAILGLSPFTKPKDVMRAMVREYHKAPSEFTGNTATEYGQGMEAVALGDFEIETGLDVEEVGFLTSADHDWLGASPDGLTSDGAVLEIKCPYGKRESAEFASILEQPHYFAQTQLEMLCSNRTKCHFYQWSPVGTRLETVELSKVWLEQSLPKLKAFYDQYLIEIKNPDKHLAPITQSKEADFLVQQYKSTKEIIEHHEARLKEFRQKLIDMAGGEKTCFSGELLVYPIERKGSVSYAKVIKEHLPDLDLEPYRGKPTKTWGIR